MDRHGTSPACLGMLLRWALLLSCALVGCVGHAIVPGRRAFTRQVLVAVTAGIPCNAAEPEPMRTLTDEEMAARVARKQQLLREQSARAKGDAKIMFGAEFQMGKRDTKQEQAGKPAFLKEFLLPGDVGGVNLSPSFGAQPPGARVQ